jgi:hypothetical protein
MIMGLSPQPCNVYLFPGTLCYAIQMAVKSQIDTSLSLLLTRPRTMGYQERFKQAAPE